MPDATRLRPHISAKTEQGAVDRLIAALAQAQHGVVGRPQLLDADVTRHEIARRVYLHRLQRLHRGVYAVGHRRITREGRWMAAVLAAGPGAVLSHRAAGALWGIWWSDVLEVTVPAYRAVRAITVHTSPLPPDEVTSVNAIPVTTMPRTLLDLATVLPHHQLERAINETEVRGHTDLLSLADLVERYPRRHGVPAIKAILKRGPAFTRSELEARFVAFIRKARLPSPSLNARIEGFECDCVWHEHRVIAELDGHATHATQAAFERDRARDRSLSAAGWRVVRVTWRHLHEDAEAIARDLGTMLRPLDFRTPA